MNFKEQLNKVNELNISICDLDIANEADCTFEFEYTNEEFEQLCSVMQRAYLKAEDMTTWALARTINDLIMQGDEDDKKWTVSEVIDIDTWDLIEKASWNL